MSETHRDTAPHGVPPPLLYLGALVVGLLLSAFVPTPVLSGAPASAAGLILILAGIVVMATAFAAMRRAGESPSPMAPTHSLVTGGPFQYTRNPIYVAFTLIYAGVAVALSSAWALVLLLVVLVIMDRNIIVSEERYLQGRLGDSYAQYRARVRRWL